MSSANPSHSRPPSSHSAGQDTLARPESGSHVLGETPGRPEQQIESDPQRQGYSSTYDPGDGPTNPESDPTAQGIQTEQPLFQPFFTLIEDAHTAESYHPTVHYIFSDDDTDIITEAAIRSLETQQSAQPAAKQDHIPRQAGTDAEEKSFLLPPPIPGVRENYIVLDVEAVNAAETATNPSLEPSKPSETGAIQPLSTSPASQAEPKADSTQSFRVASAKSFSPTWQVLNSELVPAPTFENGNPGDTPGHGLMLKIHGTAGVPSDTGKEQGEKGAQRLEEMMEQFSKRMRELQMVIDATHTEEEGNTTKELAGDHDLEVKEDVRGKDVFESEHH